MFNSQVLEIAIGLTFVYLIASLLASVVRELIESVRKTRAVQLEGGLRLLLDNPSGKQAMTKLFAHPQIFGLFDGVYDPDKLTGLFRCRKKSEPLVNEVIVAEKVLQLPLGSKFPSYVPSHNFALALLDPIAAVRASSVYACNAAIAVNDHRQRTFAAGTNLPLDFVPHNA